MKVQTLKIQGNGLSEKYLREIKDSTLALSELLNSMRKEPGLVGLVYPVTLVFNEEDRDDFFDMPS